ncbi:MAG: pseudouridine-5'-phosphate glycosidase [Halanaerobiales bacterium]
MKKYLVIKPEVKEALSSGKPVVALESTIIAHGMPYPENVQTAIDLENTIRKQGAVPATVGIINGQIKVGLSESEIEDLAKADKVYKVSRRDFPFVLSAKEMGATTVAGTMIAAARAGIEVFVTGGIGGVHKGAESNFDISADLQELKETNVTVVAAGAKSILDIGLTLERLETFGVPVLGYKTEEFPAFYSRSSGFKVDYRVNDPREAARIIKTKRTINLGGGILIANPIPEKDEIKYEVINSVINQAQKEAEKEGITGKELTPFLLDKIKELTGGTSLKANISLVKNNAMVGARVARELQSLN